MQVFHWAVLVIHVQRLVCVVVVIGILAVRDHVIQVTSTLCDVRGAKHCQRLPQKNSQKDQGDAAKDHCE
jgi:hypothetical protein